MEVWLRRGRKMRWTITLWKSPWYLSSSRALMEMTGLQNLLGDSVKAADLYGVQGGVLGPSAPSGSPSPGKL